MSATSGHSITAVYSGDTHTLGSQSTPIAQLVEDEQTVTSVATSLTPSLFGQSVTFTATVSVQAPGSDAPTGTINFFDGPTRLNSIPATLSLVGGQYEASFSTSTLSVNSTSGHSITAVYSGDADSSGNQSTPLAARRPGSNRHDRQYIGQHLGFRSVGDLYGHGQRNGTGLEYPNRYIQLL